MSVIQSKFADVEYTKCQFRSSNTLALVLAGGRGSRLHELTDWRAKPAVPFGGKYKLIDFVLSNCINSGISSIGIVTQYKSHSLNRHIQKGWQCFGSSGEPSIELLPAQQRTIDQSWYAGTADAIYQNLDIIQAHNPDYVLILSADHVYKMNYLPMIQAHVDSGANVTIGTTFAEKTEASRFGVLQSDESGLVKRFIEKPPQSVLEDGFDDRVQISMGIYVFNAQFLYEQLVLDHSSTATENDFGKNLIPSLIAEESVYSYKLEAQSDEYEAYWRDVGTVDSYYEANMELIGVVPSLNLHDNTWPIRTTQGQSAPAKFVFDERNYSGNVYNSMVSDGSIIIGSDIVNSLISKDVQIESSSVIEESILLPGAKVGKNCRLYRTIIDKNCVIPEGMAIGFDKSFSEENFRVTEQGITLVTQAMLEEVKQDMPLAA